MARELDMAILGPNAEGFLNARMPLAATFSPAVVHVENGLRPEASRARGVAIVSQSGGAGFSFFHRGRPKALDFSFVVSMGNEAGLDAMDVAGYLVEDEETAVVLAFLEGVRAPEKLLRVATRAAGLGKPLVVAKVGRSEAAAAAAASHTASLAGSARAYDAVFRRYGILPGEDQDHMMLRGLRGRRLLDGVRGAPSADTDALIRLLVAVSGFAEAAGGALEALDLNPVIVHPRGQGVSVADAGIVTGGARPAAAARNP